MKKITLLLLMLSICGYAQGTFVFDFEDELSPNDRWTIKNGLSTSIASGDLNLTFTVGATNPSFATATGGIDADTYKYVEVTLKNPSDLAPTYLRMSFPNGEGGRNYINQEIDNDDGTEKPYYFDVSDNSAWAGTMNDIKFHFKNTGNTTFTGPDPAVSLAISEITFHEVSYSTNVKDPSFENFNSGWSIDTATGTTLTIDAGEGVGSSKAAAINFSGTLVSSDVKVENGYTYMFETPIPETHVAKLNYWHRFSGLTAQVQLAFKLSKVGGGTKTFYQGWKTPGATYVEAPESRILDEGNAEVVTYESITVFFRVKGGDATTKIYLDDIVAYMVDENGDAVLEVNIGEQSTEKVYVYPNPVTNVLTISSEVTSVEMYTILGQKVVSLSNVNSIDTSALETGNYILRITEENGSKTSKRVYKK